MGDARATKVCPKCDSDNTAEIQYGMPIHWVRDRLGHSSMLVTSKYLHVS